MPTSLQVLFAAGLGVVSGCNGEIITSTTTTTSTSSGVGGAPSPITMAAGQQYVGAIAVDATNVYWINGEANGTVMKCPVDGCNGSPIALATGQAYPAGIAVDTTSVYWANQGGSIMKCAIGGCGDMPTSLWAS